MEEITIKAKGKYLKENYPFDNVPKLKDKKFCIHCEQIITVGDYKVFRDKQKEQYICCPNAPECDGTLSDWFTVDETHYQ